ncbi:hypothetical protein CI105_03825 [Candidatus Izimaplasma bacterium ZiA1]|uniref:DUF2177 family protein n=1 Tax=Candidatus Izimoplasma sp. ZiA1 TaxID=2024899 RepID=UPI000BAA5081|nr:hypothetical protein CI105_03825 [Candidatus Izimaplasma bacterium ZiA1]
MDFLKAYLVSFVIFLVIDAVWLTLVAPKFYKSQIGHLMSDTPNLIAALIFYLIFIVGIVYFVLQPALETHDFVKLIISAVLFGFITYATYDLTNLATLKDWPIKVTIVDLIWGTSLSSIVSILAYLVLK